MHSCDYSMNAISYMRGYVINKFNYTPDTAIKDYFQLDVRNMKDKIKDNEYDIGSFIYHQFYFFNKLFLSYYLLE